MLIIDENNQSIDTITLLLTECEAKELRDSLESILQSKVGVSHSHVNNSSYSKEITVCTYMPGKISDEGFNEHIKKLILAES